MTRLIRMNQDLANQMNILDNLVAEARSAGAQPWPSLVDAILEDRSSFEENIERAAASIRILVSLIREAQNVDSPDQPVHVGHPQPGQFRQPVAHPANQPQPQGQPAQHVAQGQPGWQPTPPWRQQPQPQPQGQPPQQNLTVIQHGGGGGHPRPATQDIRLNPTYNQSAGSQGTDNQQINQVFFGHTEARP